MNPNRGDIIRLRTGAISVEGALADPDKLLLRIIRPNGEGITRSYPSGSDIVRVSLGEYYSDVIGEETGRWEWRWETSDGDSVEFARNGYFDIEPDQFSAVVTDLRDTRALIPRVRRGLEGAIGTGPANANASTFTDDQVNAVIADAIADCILYTGGLFGHQLNVTERESGGYMAPIAWQVDPALAIDEESIIVAQAQLNYFFFMLKGLKVQETIRDEATEWSYQLSANALTEYLKNLRKTRDEALARITEKTEPAEAWESFLATRDTWTASIIEPFTDPGRGIGGLELDPRAEIA